MRVVIVALALGIAALGGSACTDSDRPPEPTVSPASFCPSPCPDCPPAPDPQGWGEECAGLKAMAEAFEILVGIAEEHGGLAGMTESEARADLTGSQQLFDRDCQGVALAEPSLLTAICMGAGKWKGALEERVLQSPSAQTMVWINQFNNIINEYCDPS